MHSIRKSVGQFRMVPIIFIDFEGGFPYDSVEFHYGISLFESGIYICLPSSMP